MAKFCSAVSNIRCQNGFLFSSLVKITDVLQTGKLELLGHAELGQVIVFSCGPVYAIDY